MKGAFRDYTGQTFNSLTGIKHISSHPQGSYWLWRCVCGVEVIRRANNVSRGSPKSCGCDRELRSQGHSASATGPVRAVRALTALGWLGGQLPADGLKERGRIYREGRKNGISIKDELARDADEVGLALMEYVEPEE